MVKLLVKLLKHSIVHFTNMIKSLEIFTLKVIVKFRKRPSIKTINDSFANRSFSFSVIEQKNVSSEINELYSLKALQDTMFHKNLEKKCRFFGAIFAYSLIKQLLHQIPIFFELCQYNYVF